MPSRQVMRSWSRNLSRFDFVLSCVVDSWSYIMKHGSEDLVEKFLSEAEGGKAASEEQTAQQKEQTALQSQLYIAAFWGLLDTVKNLIAAGKPTVTCRPLLPQPLTPRP